MAEQEQPQEQPQAQPRKQPRDEAHVFPIVRLVDEEGRLRAEMSLPPDDLFVGNVLAAREGGEKKHFLVKAVEEGEPVTLRVVRAKPILRQALILLTVLAACWFLIDFLIQFLKG